MVEFKNVNEKLFLYKNEELVSEIIEPTVLWDSIMNRILQIGDKENVLKYHKIALEVCKKHDTNIHVNWSISQLPTDADVLNQIIKNPAELKEFPKQEIVA